MTDSPSPGAATDAPVFIVGANRSGTTLLRLILNAHSRIAIPEELVYFGSYIAGVPVERWRRPGLSPGAYAAFVDRFLQEDCEPLDGLSRDRLKREILDGGPHDLRRPYRLVLDRWARQHGKVRWGEKTPSNLFYADVIRDMFPAARFIHLVRDPRAGVCSMGKVSFFSDDVAFNALAWRRHLREGRALLERHVPASHRMTLRYEDLVTRPEAVVRSLCAFLGEAYEPSMLHFHQEAERFMKQEAAGDFNSAATRPITDDKVDAWRGQLRPDEVALIEALCEAEMRAFDYEPERPVLSLQRRLGLHLRTNIKKVYWKLQCWRHRDIRHYTVKSPMFARTRTRLQKLAHAVSSN